MRRRYVVSQMEITYSRFEKTLEFPASIEGAKLEHNYTDGLLLVYLKKEINSFREYKENEQEIITMNTDRHDFKTMNRNAEDD